MYAAEETVRAHRAELLARAERERMVTYAVRARRAQRRARRGELAQRVRVLLAGSHSLGSARAAGRARPT